MNAKNWRLLLGDCGPPCAMAVRRQITPHHPGVEPTVKDGPGGLSKVRALASRPGRATLVYVETAPGGTSST